MPRRCALTAAMTMVPLVEIGFGLPVLIVRPSTPVSSG
jgi:hypothetical protein